MVKIAKSTKIARPVDLGAVTPNVAPTRTAASPPRITIELVPSTCWFSNIRDHVDTDTWDRLRRQTYRDVNRRCAVCGGVGLKWPVECHELWEYDEETCVQKLLGLTGLCPACHEAKHMGLANTRGRGQDARRHLARVNGWTASETEEYVADAFTVWRERSQHEWVLDLAWLEQFGIRVDSRRGDSPRPTAPPRPAPASPSARALAPETGVGARMPSEVADDFWVRAKRTGDDYPAHTERGGKWLVFVPTADLDEVWGRIKAALEAGSLGTQAKASTALPNPNAADSAEKVICVYTYDGDDEADVWRVRAGLRRLGITQPLFWKGDQATRDGQYQVRGNTRVSRYRG